jgi:hypothetical protein
MGFFSASQTVEGARLPPALLSIIWYMLFNKLPDQVFLAA